MDKFELMEQYGTVWKSHTQRITVLNAEPQQKQGTNVSISACERGGLSLAIFMRWLKAVYVTMLICSVIAKSESTTSLKSDPGGQSM